MSNAGCHVMSNRKKVIDSQNENLVKRLGIAEDGIGIVKTSDDQYQNEESRISNAGCHIKSIRKKVTDSLNESIVQKVWHSWT